MTDSVATIAFEPPPSNHTAGATPAGAVAVGAVFRAGGGEHALLSWRGAGLAAARRAYNAASAGEARDPCLHEGFPAAAATGGGEALLAGREGSPPAEGGGEFDGCLRRVRRTLLPPPPVPLAAAACDPAFRPCPLAPPDASGDAAAEAGGDGAAGGGGWRGWGWSSGGAALLGDLYDIAQARTHTLIEQ
jgi:hypothetical protein